MSSTSPLIGTTVTRSGASMWYHTHRLPRFWPTTTSELGTQLTYEQKESKVERVCEGTWRRGMTACARHRAACAARGSRTTSHTEPRSLRQSRGVPSWRCRRGAARASYRGRAAWWRARSCLASRSWSRARRLPR
eukprot:scaffold2909_cov28-Tisochrysis_lutea.AAC.3